MDKRRKLLKEVIQDKDVDMMEKSAVLMTMLCSLNAEISALQERIYFESNKQAPNDVIVEEFATELNSKGMVSKEDMFEFKKYIGPKFDAFRKQDFKDDMKGLLAKMSTQIIGLLGISSLFEKVNFQNMDTLERFLISLGAAVAIFAASIGMEKFIKSEGADYYKKELAKLEKLRQDIENETTKIFNELGISGATMVVNIPIGREPNQQ